MLYITTRGNTDAFTAHRTLVTDRAPDGGLFIPMRYPQLSEDELRTMVAESFEATVANVVNIFFRTDLTQWDVGFCFGRNTMRITGLTPKIIFSELWHNPGSGIDYILCGLLRRIYGEEDPGEPSEWFRLVVKIAIILGIYGELCRQEIINFGECFDFSVPADDFSYPMAILYSSALGLPVGDVVCNCVKSGAVWNLLHRGELVAADMDDSLKASAERLLLHRLGEGSTALLEKDRVHHFESDIHAQLREGLICFVYGTERALQTMTGAFRNTGKLLTPDAALCIAGLGDYRAKLGESKFTLIIEENSPALYPVECENATGLPARKIGDYLKE